MSPQHSHNQPLTSWPGSPAGPGGPRGGCRRELWVRPARGTAWDHRDKREGDRALKSLTHLALEGAALHRGKEETALEEGAAAGSGCTPLGGGFPGWQELPAGQGCGTKPPLAMGHPQGTGSVAGGHSPIAPCSVSARQESREKGFERDAWARGGDGLGRGRAVLTIMSMMVLMVSSTSISRVGFRLVAVKLRR